jgi:hypothetical protein
VEASATLNSTMRELEHPIFRRDSEYRDALWAGGLDCVDNW